MDWLIILMRQERPTRRGCLLTVVLVVVVVLGGGIGGESGSTLARCRQGQTACSAGGAHCNDNKEVGEHATVGAGNGGKSRGCARADNNQPKSDTKCSKYY